MAIDHQPLRFDDFPAPGDAHTRSPEPKPVSDSHTIDHLRRLARSSMTPGILEGMTIYSTDGGSTSGQTSYLTADPAAHLTVGPTSYVVTVGTGTAVGPDGELIQLTDQMEVDLSPVLSGPADATGHLYISQHVYSRPSAEAVPHGTLRMSQEAGRPQPEPQTETLTGSKVHLHLPGEPMPRHGVPIASLKGDRSAATLLLSPISAWLTASSVLVGSRTGTGLVITDDTIVANRSLHLLGGVGSRGRQGHVIVGPRQGENLVLGGTEITARVDERAAELYLQRDGGELHIGGPLRGPEGEPLAVTGGSDISLGGGGVLMLGSQDRANLVLDENEIMAREAGQSVPLLLQWEGGETRFGGPLRGPADGPLNIVSSKDLSLGGHGALMIGPKEAAHLVVDENEIMASAGPKAANLYIQWHGGETHFGGTVCGPDDGPLTVTGEQHATLQGNSGSLMVGSRDNQNLIFDDHQMMARDGDSPSTLDLQATGGSTRFGGAVELTVRHDESAEPAGGWELRVDRPEVSLAATDGTETGDLVLSHDSSPMTWFDAAAGGRLVTRNDGSSASTMEQIDDATALVRKLRPSKFCADKDSAESPASPGTMLGFDAEQVMEVAPELVRAKGGTLGLCLSDFAVIAIAAIQEQQLTIDRLERKVAALVGEGG